MEQVNINEIFTWVKKKKICTRIRVFVICVKIGDKYSKKLMNTATKNGAYSAKTASKRVLQKTAEATGDLIGNKTADKITSVSKSKSKEKEDKTNEIEEIYIPPKKDSKQWR